MHGGSALQMRHPHVCPIRLNGHSLSSTVAGLPCARHEYVNVRDDGALIHRCKAHGACPEQRSASRAMSDGRGAIRSPKREEDVARARTVPLIAFHGDVGDTVHLLNSEQIIPATQQIGTVRLLRIGNNKSGVFSGHIHLRSRGEVIGVLLRAVEHHYHR